MISHWLALPSRLKREGMTARDEKFAGRHTCGILRTEANKSIRVLIECKEYAYSAGKRESAELVSRPSKITKLLRVAGPGFRSLPGSGFYHNLG